MALDYSMILNKPNVGNQIMQGLQLYQQQQALDMQRQKAEQEAQMQAQQAARAAEFRAAFGQASTPQEKAALASQFPEMLDTIKSAVGMDQDLKTQAIGEIGMQMTALANDPAAAAEYVRQNADVLSSLGPAFDPGRILQQLETNPQGLVQTADMLTMAALGPEKYQEIVGQREDRSIRQQGQAIQMRGQDIQMRGQDITARGQQIAQQNAQLAAASRIEAARMRQEGSGFPDLSVNMEKALDTAIVNATSAENEAAKMEALAERYMATDMPGGRAAQFSEWFKQQTGTEDDISALRAQYLSIKNSRIIESLPTGPATDRDVEIFSRGFPTDFANKEYIASWMRGMAKVKRAEAEMNNFRAEWISQNGNPGQNRRPFEYNGVQIDQGESLKKAFDRYIEQNPPWQTQTPGFSQGANTAPAQSGGIQFLGFE